MYIQVMPTRTPFGGLPGVPHTANEACSYRKCDEGGHGDAAQRDR